MTFAATDSSAWAGAVIFCGFFLMCAVIGYAERRWPSCDCRKRTTETEKNETPENGGEEQES